MCRSFPCALSVVTVSRSSAQMLNPKEWCSTGRLLAQNFPFLGWRSFFSEPTKLSDCATLLRRVRLTENCRSMEVKKNIARCLYLALIAVCCTVPTFAQATFTKAQVADRIRRVEDGVDQFRKWAEQRGDTAKSNAQTAKTSGRTRRSGNTPSDAQKQSAQQTKDDLNDALSDLDRSTNRLRRKFDPLDTLDGNQGANATSDGRRQKNQSGPGSGQLWFPGRKILGSPAQQSQ